MVNSNQIPSLPELALQYGTISSEQLSHIQRLSALKEKQDKTLDFETVMVSQKFATAYQVGLLKLIQEYLIIKKKGEEFGKIAIEKGYATQEDVDKALLLQKKIFKTAKIKKLIGDILVESQVITEKQKNAILKEQILLDAQAEKILSENPEKEPAPVSDPEDKKEPDVIQLNPDVKLSEYEAQFLQIKALDNEFCAAIIEKGLATSQQVKAAQRIQEKAFEADHHIKILGDIMVDLKFITLEQKNSILEEQKRKVNQETKADINVIISEDQMEAEIVLSEKKENIRLQDIKAALEQKGIKYGIYPDAMIQCCLDMRKTQFIAAKQDFSMELIKSRKARYLFDTSKIDTVEKKRGEPLAEKVLSNDAYLKKNLFGDNIEQRKEEVFTFRCASGVRMSKDETKAFAGKTGFPSLSIERKLFVHPVINVLEDADLRYGPLEEYASLNISGVLTGAYPVYAGQINAEEIRGARIEAIGDVKSRVGITDSVISAQGDIYARYLHNCRIETFGNIYIENEVIDSQVFSSGKIDSPRCHVVSSSLYGKKGIEISGAGNQRTRPCVLGAGTEHHILEKVRQYEIKITNITQELSEFQERKAEQKYYAKKIFQKMLELKIFHDRAKNKKEKLAQEFRKKKDFASKENLENIIKLINSFEKKIKGSIASLKNLNQTKNRYEKEADLLEKKIKDIEPGIKNKIHELKIDLFAFFEWARKEQSTSRVKIHGTAFPGTILSGIYSSTAIETLEKNILAAEKQTEDQQYKIYIQKNL
ncbi:MAG: DUF342 domain-containing protein [Proteobacteria bacterium]|nr:DUF342 domain-containing protein [Pseudomonadota bacterium]MBU1390086.1 DUF342 domain-containing protein [Pseudomonadota bacterium]MBU1544963.1 DUF342 domain-containing protein [Pseudomonadota bacterium]MBU2482299.1 DUF342 domain-containing protein [Pseudomonadota bacterium]